MPYNFYLVIHVFMAFCLVILSSYLCLSEAYSKKLAGLYGGIGVLLFVAGFGLLAKAGYGASQPWVIGKMVIWGLFMIAVPIVAKRFPAFKKKVFYGSLALLFLVIYLAVNKPV